MTDIVKRVQKFLEEWQKMRFSGNVIHGLHSGGEREANLMVSDIEAILSENERLRGGKATGLNVGDKVQKLKGYKWPGEVVATFQTRSGATRIVVECTVPEVAGALHIYNPEQVEPI